MKRSVHIRLAALAGTAVAVVLNSAQAATILLPLQTRDEQNRPVVSAVQVEGSRIGVVVMDMWDRHWDPLATRRVAALVPRMNQFLHNARAAGAQVIFSPSNTLEATYAASRQRSAAQRVPQSAMPAASHFQPAEPIPWTTCPRNMDGTFPYHSPPVSACANQCYGLDVEEGDLITADDRGIDARQELWNIVRAEGLTHLMYVGVHTNWCVSNRPNGAIPMKRLGLTTVLVRDLTDAWSDPYDGYERDRPRPEITPDLATQRVIEHQERCIQPTLTSEVFPETVPVRPVAIRGATAEFSQPGYPISAAIDGSTAVLTGWGNGGNPRGENAAVFEMAGKVGEAGGSLLTVVLDFTGHPNHGIGRFRISATAAPLDGANGGPDRAKFDAAWTTLRPESVRSLSAGTLFRIADDGTVLVTASQRPKCDRYVVRMRTDRAGITALRLEALRDDSLPERGPGLRETNGNFVLGEFSVRISPLDKLPDEQLRRWLTPACHDVSAARRSLDSGFHIPASPVRQVERQFTAGWTGDAATLRAAITDLMDTFGPRYPHGARYLARLDALEPSRPSDPASKEALAALAQEALTANPLLDFDQLFVVKRRPLTNGQPVNADTSFGGDLGLPRSSASNSALPKNAFDNEIAVLHPVSPAGRLTTLYRPVANEFVGDVDLNFDADRLLFSMRDGRGRWQIFELGLDPHRAAARGQPRQIGRGDQPDVDNYDACYLPDGRIVFCSSACFQGVPCNFSDVAVLYRMDADGGNVRQLCFEQDHDFNPVVLDSGRVLYLRWEYSDLPHSNSRRLFTMNPDGTNQMVLYGSNSYWPNGVFGARSIPAQPGKIIGIVAGHHGSYREGELVLLDVGRGRHEAQGVVQRIPGRGRKVEPLVRDYLTAASWPKFVHPYPLSDKYFLVTCKLDEHSSWDLYLVDGFDNLLRLHHADGYALFEPIPLRRQMRPPILPDRIDPQRPDAVVYLADIYRGPGLADVPRGAVRQLRLFTYHFAYQGMGGLLGTVGLDGPWDIKRVLGTVPVEADGSALFRIPANTPISLQPLDAEGKALQLMRSWLVGMPGETVSCVGCHEEHQSQTPVSLQTLAARKEPSEIAPWHGPPRNFSFRREVQPVLDRYCVGCHSGTAEGSEPDLRGTVLTGDYRSNIYGHGHAYGGRFFSVGYFELSRRVRRPGIESDMHLLQPAEYHADTTELVRMLLQGHYGVSLDAESWDRVITWIDLNAPYHGTWTEMGWDPGRQRERRRELSKLYAGRDEDPESLASVPVATSQLAVSKDGCNRTKSPENGAAPQSRQPAVAGPVARRSVDLGDGISLDLALVPPGQFMIGDSKGERDEQPPSLVQIEQPFWLGTCEVTNRQYACYDPTHDSRFESKNGYQFGVTGFALNRPDQPVVRVSWHEAVGFCDWLSQRTGRQFTLPTEAQWEYACRAGIPAAFSFGDLAQDFSRSANAADLKLREFATSPYTVYQPVAEFTKYDDWIPHDTRYSDDALVTVEVGRYQPNGWGLHDMHGNVAEWTRSRYRPYPYDTDDGREDESADGPRAIRGGSWRDRPADCRSASRWRYPAWQRVYNVGFRVAAR